ncbi:MAG: dynamin family protein [Saprospiraceae bacterium]
MNIFKFNPKLEVYQSLIDESIKNLHQLTQDIQHKELMDTVSELRSRIKDPFMFVVVGEVKSGKSSFINALLGSFDREICKVAPMPMTDTIQQILYGPVQQEVFINSYFKKVFEPVDILKEIAIVDTPGTNTIVEHHQEITERFIPSADLIVFVFESKNPYRQSAWEFFDFISEEWRKKVIFVLQQKDLMNAQDLAINMKGVAEYALKKGMSDSKIFAVSAKMELDKDFDQSGFADLRKYINENILQGKAPFIKLYNNISTAQNINDRIYKGILDRKEQYIYDLNFRNDIRTTLDEQETKSKLQVDVLIENLLTAYDRATIKTENELDSGLGMFSVIKRSVISVFSKSQSVKDWLSQLLTGLEKDLQFELQGKLSGGISDIADNVQQMGKIIDLKIRNSRTILKDNHELFAEIAERRANVFRDLQDAFTKFMNKAENFSSAELFPGNESLSPQIAGGAGMGIVGIVLAAIAKGTIFDVTGGVISGLGFLFAGAVAFFQKRKFMNGYKKEINKGRNELESEVRNKLNDYIVNIRNKIESSFNDFDGLLQYEESQLKKLDASHQLIKADLEKQEKELKQFDLV